MIWVGELASGETIDVGPGQEFDPAELVAVTCEGHRVPIPSGAEFHRLERSSIGGTNWRVGIIAVDEELHIIPEGGLNVIHQHGWGTDVLTGPPRLS